MQKVRLLYKIPKNSDQLKSVKINLKKCLDQLFIGANNCVLFFYWINVVKLKFAFFWTIQIRILQQFLLMKEIQKWVYAFCTEGVNKFVPSVPVSKLMRALRGF